MTTKEKFQWIYNHINGTLFDKFLHEERIEFQVIWSKYDFRTRYHRVNGSLTEAERNGCLTSILTEREMDRLNYFYKKVKALNDNR